MGLLEQVYCKQTIRNIPVVPLDRELLLFFKGLPFPKRGAY